VPTAALAALGVGARGGPADRALHVAGELDLLVVMDNCEHLLDAVADVVGHLLAGGRARVLATSRERLGVPGEHVVRVDPLETSGATASARVLFLERAAATGAVEDLTQVDPAAVDRVVRRLDGLPLAIEMAAARTAALTVAELADLLEAELGADTQGELSHPDRFAAERHRTLHGVIAWSRALLDPVERAALTGWPVFAGPVEAQDAVRVLATTRSTVESLSRRSLLLPLPDPVTGRTRYRMLHTVRSALMSEPDRPVLARAAHAHHLVEVARAADAALRGPDEPAAVARLGSVIAELRAAHTWSRAARPELAAELSAALHPFAVSTLDEEVLGWAARLVPVLPPGSPAAAVAQVAMASRLLHSGDLADAVARAGSALEVTDDPRVRLYAYEVLADAAIYDGRLEDCHALGLRLAELAREAHDQHFLGIAAGSVSLGLAYAGDRSGARARLEALRAELESGYAPLAPTVQGWLAYARGEIDLEEDPVAAAACLHRAIRLADSAGNRYLGGVARVSATSLRGRHGDPAEALVEFAGVVRWWLDRGDRTHLVTTLRNLVDVLHRVGDDVAAAELWGAVGSDTLSVSFGAERRRLDRARETLGDRLGEDRLAAHLRAGAERDVVSAAHVALAAVAGSRA
ncbi:MAG TPA: hypothetical protein VN257_11425, partial [Actinotalea sp.]|nr:hypothetical protein [Actinotalea sp.]